MRPQPVLIICLLVLTGIVAAIARNSSNFATKEITAMSECSVPKPLKRIENPYANMEHWKIPAVIPLNDEQRSYVSEVVLALVKVIGEVSSLEKEENVLGCGQFFWPKNPDEPVKVSKSYFGEHFRMAGLAARLQRKSETSPWTRAGLTVHPHNFPGSVYQMQLPPALFNDFELKKVVQEDRHDERIKAPIVFYFEHKKIKDFNLRIEARDDVASVRDSLPTSFHTIKMIRGSQ